MMKKNFDLLDYIIIFQRFNLKIFIILRAIQAQTDWQY